MSELITLSRKSPECESYLRGSFSKVSRAIPLQTLNVNSAAESITFKIVPIEAIAKPTKLQRILTTFKIRSFLLVLLPMFAILAKTFRQKQF